MLNESLKIEKREGGNFEPLSENLYQVELLDIELQEKPSYKDHNVLEKVFSFQFTVLDKEFRGRNLWANFIPTYLYISAKNGKNKLYRIIEALNGKEITPEEEATLDNTYLNNLIGKQCKVMIEIKESGDKKFNNILKFLKSESVPGLTPEEKIKSKVKKDDKEEDEVKVEDIPF